VFDARPVIINGEDDPVTVSPVGLEVTVKEDAAGDVAGNSKAMLADPLLYGLAVPTSETELIIGLYGSKKSFEDCDLRPALLLIFKSPYAFRSP
jgi:hypothetical protein